MLKNEKTRSVVGTMIKKKTPVLCQKEIMKKHIQLTKDSEP